MNSFALLIFRIVMQCRRTSPVSQAESCDTDSEELGKSTFDKESAFSNIVETNSAGLRFAEHFHAGTTETLRQRFDANGQHFRMKECVGISCKHPLQRKKNRNPSP